MQQCAVTSSAIGRFSANLHQIFFLRPPDNSEWRAMAEGRPPTRRSSALHRPSQDRQRQPRGPATDDNCQIARHCCMSPCHPSRALFCNENYRKQLREERNTILSSFHACVAAEFAVFRRTSFGMDGVSANALFLQRFVEIRAK